MVDSGISGHRRRLWLMAAILLPILPVAADQLEARPGGREEVRFAWEWRNDQRIAERLDPVRIRERGTLDATPGSSGRTPAPAAQHITEISDADNIEYVIDGQRNPELFLPYELFDALLSGLSPDADLRAKQRGFYAPSIRALGLDEAQLWEGLEAVAGTYLVLKYTPTKVAGGEAEMRTAQAELCRARHDAMEAASHLFSRERFDKVLYTVIAPSMRSATAVTNLEDHQRSLAAAARGCR